MEVRNKVMLTFGVRALVPGYQHKMVLRSHLGYPITILRLCSHLVSEH